MRGEAEAEEWVRGERRTGVLVERLGELVEGGRHLEALAQHALLSLDAHVLGPLHKAVQRLLRGQRTADACESNHPIQTWWSAAHSRKRGACLHPKGTINRRTSNGRATQCERDTTGRSTVGDAEWMYRRTIMRWIRRRETVSQGCWEMMSRGLTEALGALLKERVGGLGGHGRLLGE